MEDKTGESTTSTAHAANLPYSTNPHSYQHQQPPHQQPPHQHQQPPHQQQHQMYTVSPPYITADNNGGVSATEIHHHSGSGGVGYTSLNEGGDGGGGEGSQLEGSVDDIPGKGPGGVPEKYFTLDFEDCFTEDKNTKTIPLLYKVISVIYKYTKLVLYHIFVILIGIPLAIIWAISNGITVFVLVWMWGPLLRVTIVWVYALAPLFTVPMHALFQPVVDMTARIFRKIHINANINGNLGKNLGRGREHTA